MELPHFHVLHWHAHSQRHADPVAGIDVRIGGVRINAARTAGGKHGRPRLDEYDLSSFDADGDRADDDTVLVLDQVDGEPLRQEHRSGADVPLVQRVQQGVSGPVRRRAGAGCLAAPAEVFRLSAERSLVDAAVLVARERQAHVFEFVDRLRTRGAHELDGVLVADVIRSLDRVVHVPAPVVVGIFAADGAGDAALGGNRVRPRREHLGQHGGVESRLCQLQPGPHAGAAAADDDAIEFHDPQRGHASLQITETAHTP